MRKKKGNKLFYYYNNQELVPKPAKELNPSLASIEEKRIKDDYINMHEVVKKLNPANGLLQKQENL